MAEYTPNLNLFKPGTDDNISVEDSLSTNMVNVDTKLGDSLKDRTGKTFASLGARLNEQQLKYDDATTDVTDLKKKKANTRMDDRIFRTIADNGMFMAPRNTLASFKLAVDAGFYGISTALRLSSDNRWVAIQNDTVDSTSNGTGTVISKTLTTLRTLDVGSKFGSFYKDERIPTVEEVLDLCKLGGVVPYLEIKSTTDDLRVQDLVNIIKRRGMEDIVVITSGTYANLQKVRYYSDRIAVGYISAAVTQANADNVIALDNSFVMVDKTLATTANITLLQDNLLDVEVTAVDSNRDMRQFAIMGVRAVITDRIPWTGGY